MDDRRCQFLAAKSQTAAEVFYGPEMLKNQIIATVLTIGMCVPCMASGDWTANVGTLSSMSQGTDCMYFTLSGIPVADPALQTGSAWFAMERGSDDASRARMARAYAMLLAAKLSATPVRVTTTGATVCNYAQVKDVYLP